MSNHIIFSVFQANCPAVTNEYNHKFALSTLKIEGIKYEVVHGVYKGNSELSILVSADSEWLVSRLCSIFNQECYLHVNDSDTATLIDGTGHAVELGLWQQVCRSVAQTYDNYTESNDNYYVCDNKLLPSLNYNSCL